MCPEIWIILSVDGENIHRRLSSLSILVPCSRGGERYSVKDLFSPILHDLDSTVLVFLGLCIIILEVNTLDKADILLSTFSIISLAEGFCAFNETLSKIIDMAIFLMLLIL